MAKYIWIVSNGVMANRTKICHTAVEAFRVCEKIAIHNAVANCEIKEFITLLEDSFLKDTKKFGVYTPAGRIVSAKRMKVSK